MSVCVQLQVDLIHPQRKRTTSFSCAARPRKRLHRTESVLDLAALAVAPQPPHRQPVQVPHNRTLRYYKEQKDRRRNLVHAALSPPLALVSQTTPAPVTPSPFHHCKPALALDPACSPLARNSETQGLGPPRALLIIPAAVRARTTCGTGVPPGSSRPSSSPCSSTRRSSPPSACLSLPTLTSPLQPKPKSKPKRSSPPTLHRRAVLACLRSTPHGEKILHMGARLAVGILGATAELERLCAGSGADDAEEMNDDEPADGDDDALGEDEETLLALELDLDNEPDFYSYTPSDSPTETEETDAPMPDANPEIENEAPPVLSASWIVLGETQIPSQPEHEWEMVE